MRSLPATLLLASVSLFSGCQSQYTAGCDPNIVATSYVHKYGVPVTQEDWKARGSDGIVTEMRKDGVRISRNYCHGTLHGETTYTFSNDETIQFVEEYIEGHRVRKTEHYPSGMPLAETEYLPEQAKIITRWFESGAPQLVEEYQSSELIAGRYYGIDGELESEVVEGEGLRIRRDAYGQLVSHDQIHQGTQTLSTTFYTNGSPHYVTPYVRGEIAGLRRSYLPSGEPEAIEEWVAGVQHGVTSLYRNGEKVAEIAYVNGAKQGLERRFRDGISIKQELHWKANQMHGPVHSYSGKQVVTDWYHEGRPVSKITYEELNGVYR